MPGSAKRTFLPTLSYRNCSGCRYFYKIADNLLRSDTVTSHPNKGDKIVWETILSAMEGLAFERVSEMEACFHFRASAESKFCRVRNTKNQTGVWFFVKMKFEKIKDLKLALTYSAPIKEYHRRWRA